MHHRWLGKCFSKEDDIRAFCMNCLHNLSPEMHWLGMWVIYAEDRDSLRDPKTQNTKCFSNDCVVIVIKVNRIDILILLRRIFCICNRSIGTRCKEFRMFCGPWMVRGCLESKVHRYFKAILLCSLYEVLKVRHSAECRVNCIVATFFIADCPRNTRVAGSRCQGVVLSLAKLCSDGMNRRQVENVEPHGCNCRQTKFCCLKCSADDCAICSNFGAFATGEEFIPRSHKCAFVICADWVVLS